MSEHYGCMCGHAPDQHSLHGRYACSAEDCDCEHYVEYDHSDDDYTEPRGGEAEAEQRHRQAEIQRELKR